MIKLFIILLICVVYPVFASAQGDLLITPTRVVFEDNKQKETLNLVNMGKDTATYSISFIQYNMNEDGSFATINKPDSGQMFADPYLRIFPRRVSLAPGEPQVIMLQYRRKTEMQAGEYRSHLYFRAEKNYKPLGMMNSQTDTTLLCVQLIPVYGISIPVIIRSGMVNVSVTLDDLKLDTQQESLPNLKLTIYRKGNISIYGDIIIAYMPVQGKPYEIGTVKGVGVYTNINKRNITVRLNKAADTSLTNGKLKVQYISNDKSKRIVYAESVMDVK